MSSVAECVDKRAVACAFGRAAANYDVVAKLQQQTGEFLMQQISGHPGRVVLDAGCGTGFFSSLLAATGETGYRAGFGIRYVSSCP